MWINQDNFLTVSDIGVSHEHIIHVVSRHLCVHVVQTKATFNVALWHKVEQTVSLFQTGIYTIAIFFSKLMN